MDEVKEVLIEEVVSTPDIELPPLVYWSATTGGFYISTYHEKEAIPMDAIQISDILREELLLGEGDCGRRIIAGVNGVPELTKPAIHVRTREEVDSERNFAYANPVTGSDRWFAEATRLTIMGAPANEVEAAKSNGVARYEEIKLEYPWP